jgi:aspartyl-tRNA(Asn)/glutamyl-tRNA(Gln) amidotransferase subunit A
MSDLHWLSVHDLAQAIAAKRLSPVAVVQAHLTRIEHLDGRLKSFLAVFAEGALGAARTAEAALAQGRSVGPLHGVPVAVKDLYAVQGTPTTAGTSFLKEPAARDCTAVARLRAAGAIILGKLNLHQFAYGPEGSNPEYGTPWNPWDAHRQRIPGGSSSGSGVAVAAGLVPMGLGSDTGGSIRIPAACCGTVGLKPTYGRVSRSGVLPLSWSLDHVGPLTRSALDAAVILRAIAGHDPADASSSALPVPDYLASLAVPVKGLRVGLLTEYLEQSAADVRAALAAAVRALTGLGCEVQDVALTTARHSLGAAHAILGPEALTYHEPLLRRHGALYATDVRRRLAASSLVAATDYVKGQRARVLIRDEINAALERVDCLLAPTLPVAAPLLDAAEVPVGGRNVPTRLALTAFTRLFNLSGHPVVSVPCGFSAEGLPLSLQLVGRGFDEATVLRLAHAYEQATEWHRQRPPVG